MTIVEVYLIYKRRHAMSILSMKLIPRKNCQNVLRIFPIFLLQNAAFSNINEDNRSDKISKSNSTVPNGHPLINQKNSKSWLTKRNIFSSVIIVLKKCGTQQFLFVNIIINLTIRRGSIIVLVYLAKIPFVNIIVILLYIIVIVLYYCLCTWLRGSCTFPLAGLTPVVKYIQMHVEGSLFINISVNLYMYPYIYIISDTRCDCTDAFV